MKKLTVLFLCLFACVTTVFSQSLVPMTAKESIDAVISHARTDFAQDAQMYLIIAPLVNGKPAFDLSTGKSEYWTYLVYSPFIDANVNYLVLNKPGLGLGFYPGTSQKGAPGLGSFLPIAEPYIDSPEALQSLKSGDAKTFFDTHANAVVVDAEVANLAQPGPPLTPGNYWMFLLAAGSDSLWCHVNAVTGAGVDCKTLTKLEGVPEAKGFRLDQNYPNPVSINNASGTTIRYAVSERQNVRLAVYDILGHEVFVAQQGVVNPGEYSTPIPSAVFRTAGMYFYFITTARGSEMKRLLAKE